MDTPDTITTAPVVPYSEGLQFLQRLTKALDKTTRVCASASPNSLQLLKRDHSPVRITLDREVDVHPLDMELARGDFMAGLALNYAQRHKAIVVVYRWMTKTPLGKYRLRVGLTYDDTIPDAEEVQP